MLAHEIKNSDCVQVPIDEMKLLLRAADDGGRCSLHLTVLYERLSLTQFIVRRDPETLHFVDNMGRKALHYACASNTPFLEQILRGFGDEDAEDVFWCLPSHYSPPSVSAQSPALSEEYVKFPIFFNQFS